MPSTSVSNWVEVMWPNGLQNDYRNGVDNAHDVKIANPEDLVEPGLSGVQTGITKIRYVLLERHQQLFPGLSRLQNLLLSIKQRCPHFSRFFKVLVSYKF